MPKATRDEGSSKNPIRRAKNQADLATPPADFALSDTPGIIERDNVNYGVCHVCEWRGPKRRSREKARRDAAEHYLLAH